MTNDRDPLGIGDLLGSRIRTRPISMKTMLAIHSTQWIGKKLATRLTPILLLLLALFGVPVAFWCDMKIILTIGLCSMIVTYATQRHVRASDAEAKQWAFRCSVLSLTGTGWIVLWHEMHAHGMAVITENMFIVYVIFGCSAWAWLYVAKLVGTKVT